MLETALPSVDVKRFDTFFLLSFTDALVNFSLCVTIATRHLTRPMDRGTRSKRSKRSRLIRSWNGSAIGLLTRVSVGAVRPPPPRPHADGQMG